MNSPGKQPEERRGLANQDAARMVQVQQLDGCPARGGAADDLIIDERKMGRPGLGPGIKQGDQRTGIGVPRLCPIRLVQVVARTGPGEVFHNGRAAARAG